MAEKEYIERGALLRRLCDGDSSKMEDYYYNAIKDAPTADVVEVVHGEWISCKNNSGYKCSRCSARIKNSEYVHGNHIWCHKCGAKMDGERKEQQ